MTTHIANIYHCVACGRIVHEEAAASPPQCCGRAMTVACQESIPEEGADAQPDSDDESSAPGRTDKPR